MSLMRSGHRQGITKNELTITKGIRFVVRTWLFVICLGQIASAQSTALRIVVIEGEGAVNIIQQKTAVNPIVEVRDRNNLPVSGVAVTFSVGGQGASFAGGASTLTLTTNAAGQAVVTGLTPTATGAVTINATAGALAFTSEVSNPFPASPPSPSGIHTNRFVFSGALNGNVITGSLTYSIKIESPGSGFPAGTGTATYTVTLQ